MRELGNGLGDGKRHDEALSVRDADLATLRRIGASERNILAVQGNLSMSYGKLGRLEEASQIQRDVYYGQVKLNGEGHEESLRAASNYASTLRNLERFEEAKALLRKVMPVARRVLGEGHRLTLKMQWVYAQSIYKDDSATLNDLRKAVTMLEETERIARRVMGGANPITTGIEAELRDARAALRARETPSTSA